MPYRTVRKTDQVEASRVVCAGSLSFRCVVSWVKKRRRGRRARGEMERGTWGVLDGSGSPDDVINEMGGGAKCQWKKHPPDNGQAWLKP